MNYFVTNDIQRNIAFIGFNHSRFFFLKKGFFGCFRMNYFTRISPFRKKANENTDESFKFANGSWIIWIMFPPRSIFSNFLFLFFIPSLWMRIDYYGRLESIISSSLWDFAVFWSPDDLHSKGKRKLHFVIWVNNKAIKVVSIARNSWQMCQNIFWATVFYWFHLLLFHFRKIASRAKTIKFRAPGSWK